MQILKVFADNNLFDEGVELIGNRCFQLYQKHLGAKSFPLRTQDVDFLIPNPLRFVRLLLDNPITIVEGGIKIRVPNPANFCLHKLIIASRRIKTDKSMKDLQQGICASVIVNRQEIKRLFDSLPKRWRGAILRMLEKSKSELPLFNDEIEELGLTL
ncbi:MAG: nucleotidyltransferase domain-containing protein [Candidatus Omnitrophica bacterium]|nr:nucleotidyltransferase domain-containing protein [Candidatus Omnitrophota bacterium]